MNFKDEEVLVKELKNGNEEAYNFFVKKHKRKIFSIILIIVKNVEDVEDVLQEVYLKVFKKISLFEGTCKLSSWIYRISINQSFEYLRGRKRIVIKNNFDIATFKDPSPSNSAMNCLLFDELKNFTKRKVDRLSKKDNDFFKLYLEGIKRKDICRLLEIGDRALKSRLHRINESMENSELKKYVQM